MFIGVYDPTMRRDRETFWGELRVYGMTLGTLEETLA